MATGLMSGKRGLIMGVANDKSIAWGIAQACHDAGAALAFTYQGEALGKRVQPLAASVGSDIVLPCDVTDEASLDAVFAALGRALGHARLPRPRHRLLRQERAARLLHRQHHRGELHPDHADLGLFLHRRRPARRAMMPDGGSLLTLTYYGAEKVMPHYNVMGVAKAALEASVKYMAIDLGPRGIRVNAISAGPMKTLAASGIGGFRYIMKWNELNAPLRRNITQPTSARPRSTFSRTSPPASPARTTTSTPATTWSG